MCFTLPYIGVRGLCEDQDPTSGLWINDLPGITFKRAALTANEEDVTGRQFLDRIDGLSVELAKRDFFTRLAGEFRFNKLIESGRIGEYGDTFSVPSVAIELEKRQDDPFSQIYIQSLDIWTEAAHVSGSQVITVADGVTTTTFSPALNAGITNVTTDFVSDQEKVTITLPAISTRDSWWTWCDCIYPKTEFTGIRVYYQCRCSSDLFACQYENLLRYPILYRMGLLFIEEVRFGDRLNRWATASEKHEQIQGHYEIKYEEAMDSLVREIKYSLGNRPSDCVSCQKTRIVDVIP